MSTLLVVVIVNTSDGAPPLIDSSDANEATNVFVGDMALNRMLFGASLSETDLERELFDMDAEIGTAAFGQKGQKGKKFGWGNAKKSSKNLYGKRRGSGSGKKKFSCGKIKTKGKSWFKKVPHKKGSWGKLKTKGKRRGKRAKGARCGKTGLFEGNLVSWGLLVCCPCSFKLGLRHS